MKKSGLFISCARQVILGRQPEGSQMRGLAEQHHILHHKWKTQENLPGYKSDVLGHKGVDAVAAGLVKSASNKPKPRVN